MEKELITKKLLGILNKINRNEINAWEDNLEDTKSVIILEDFSKNDSDENEFNPELEFKYNGWYEDLTDLIKTLKTK